MDISRPKALKWGVPALLGAVLAIAAYATWGPAGAADPKPERAQTASATQTAETLEVALKNFEGELPPEFDRLLENSKAQLSSADADETFEVGFAESLVVETWRCGWEKAHVDAVDSGDKEAAQIALTKLDTFYDLPYAKKYFDDPERAWESNVLRPAVVGDPAAMRDEVKTCAR